MANQAPPGPWTRRASPRRAAWYQQPDGTRTTLEWLLGNLHNPDNNLRLPPGGMAAARPVLVLPCKIVLTMARGSNGKVMHVRCRCMAGTTAEPSSRFYNYDPIGQATSLGGALKIWKKHCHGR